MKINWWAPAEKMHYVVVDENTLGCTPTLEAPYELQALAVSVSKGGDPRCGTMIVLSDESPKHRPATLADFESFRLRPPTDAHVL